MAEISQPETAGWGFEPHWLLIIIVSVPLAATLFWWVGLHYFDSQLRFLEYQQFAAVVTVGVAGGYQLYFWVQRNRYRRRAVCLKTGLDDRIPFIPEWIWLYSFLYYLMIGVTVVSIQDLGEGVHIIFGGLILLVTGCAIFYFFPTYVPHTFRQFEVNTLSTRYLAFVQSMDNDRNAFPSMHCALATYIGLAVMDLPIIGVWIGGAYIGFIVVSCLLVKQHVIADTIAGVALGALIFYLNLTLNT
jgi:membrane-associated phospholipid phosphatase